MYIVTGASGFIGSAMVWELNTRGIEDIICVDEMGKGSKWKNLAKRNFFEFIMKDQVLDYLEHSELTNEIQAVFHMGACSSTTETDTDFLIENNYYYSQTLFRWCADHDIPFIYASSAATYGGGENGFDDETDPFELVPLNPYGYSKVLFDRWVIRQDMTPSQWVGLKFFNVFGPQEYHKGEMASVVYKAYQQIQNGSSLKLFRSHNSHYQDGKQMRDFVYVKDITRWMFEISQNPEIIGIFNMGFGKARTWLDLGESVFKNIGKPPKIEWMDIPENIRDQYQYYTEAKMDKLLKHEISKPEWPLESAVEDYVKNYLSRKDQYL